jgi:hypothetical protein
MGVPGRGKPRSAALACLAGFAAAALAAGDAEAQSRYRQKAPEIARKQKAPPPPPGPHLFIVSLKSQRGALYANGTLVAHTPISSGTASHPTPTGIFSVIQKNRHHRSNIYSGAPMPYMQRLTWSGIALHQGHLPGYPASHGCIRLPADFANFLWRTTRLGARVIVTHDEIEPAAISHAKLFQPKPRLDVVDTGTLRRSITPGILAEVTSIATDASSSDKPEPENATYSETATELSSAAQTEIPAPILTSFFDTLEAKAKKPAPAGPVSIFISRKDRQLYVRQGFHALFNVPVSFHGEPVAIGTHVFTALDRADAPGRLHWIAVTVPENGPGSAHRIIADREDELGRRNRTKRRGSKPAIPAETRPLIIAASHVLDRIDIAPEVVERVSEYVTPGATLIVSDHGLSHETGAYTDFIVLTH